MNASDRRTFTEIRADGAAAEIERAVPVEWPCAVEMNGLGYAVMMLTPADLEDFAFGFCLSERLIEGLEDVEAVDWHEMERGILLRVKTRAALRERVIDRVRHRVSDSSCGLCGIENLDQALRPLPVLPPRAVPVSSSSIFRALEHLRMHQPLNRLTGAVHAALACDADGTVLLAREDVGRHNAFDKLIGAMLREGTSWRERFAVLSSRCSYELVEKAALAGCDTVATVSAATSLALQRAAEANIRLIPLARPDSFLCTDPS